MPAGPAPFSKIVRKSSCRLSRCILPAAIIILSTCAAPRLSASGNRANFLSHGPSVAAFGRGETGTALPVDFASYHYNPSLIASFDERSIIFSHFSLFEGSMYNFAGFCQPIKEYALGLSAVNLRSGNVEVRQKIDDLPSITRTNQWAYTVTLAGRIKQLFDIHCGLNLKYVYYDMLGHKDGGLGADLGFSREMKGPMLFRNRTTFNAGFAAQNVMRPSVKLASEKETLGSIYRLGAALSVPAVYRFLSVDTAVVLADLSLEDNAMSVLAGLEYRLMEKYVFRAGYYNGHVTSGAGYRDRAIRVDYALDLSDFSLIHRLGLSYFWAKPATDKEPSAAVKGQTGRSPLMKEAKRALKVRRKQLAEQRQKAGTLFRSAKKDYAKNRYLLATDKFREILLRYPESVNAKEYYTNIAAEMNDAARADGTGDFEKLSYARGYVSYYSQDFPEALNEWDKVLHINPERPELAEYRTKVARYLDDEKQRAKERETESNVQAAFGGGVSDFDAKNWVSCIRKMEKLQGVCRSNPFPRALEWLDKSQEYIDSSVRELAKSLKQGTASRETGAPERTPADAAGAAKKYTEGLVLYAQGKIADAINLWEIAVRLDPGHEKSRKALKKATEELELKRKQ